VKTVDHRGVFLAFVMGLILLAPEVAPASAARLAMGHGLAPMSLVAVAHRKAQVEVAQGNISRRQAKDIAEGAYPGFRAKAVDLLPSGQYAVTLSDGNSVIRVMVNASSGTVN
jgi:uncharacterized membrane protein YkoI